MYVPVHVLSYNVAKVLTIDKQTTVGEVKKMIEPFMKLPSKQFIVCTIILYTYLYKYTSYKNKN